MHHRYHVTSPGRDFPGLPHDVAWPPRVRVVRGGATMIVFVTGATSGFGAAIARRFARDGHRIIAAGRRVDRLDGASRRARRRRVHRAARRPRPGGRRARGRRAAGRSRGDRSAGQQRRPGAGARARAAGIARRLGADGRHQLQGADDDDAGGAAGNGGARSRARDQRRVDRRALALRRRQRLRRDEGVRPPVLAQPARRSARDAACA